MMVRSSHPVCIYIQSRLVLENLWVCFFLYFLTTSDLQNSIYQVNTYSYFLSIVMGARNRLTRSDQNSEVMSRLIQYLDSP